MKNHFTVLAVALAVVAVFVRLETALAEEAQPPLAKLTIVQPSAGSVVSGETAIVVEAEVPTGAAMPARMLASLGGVPWGELKNE